MTNAAALRRVASVFVDVTAPRMRQHGRCIAATRLGIDTLARFGIAADPVCVDVRVLNPAAVQWLADGSPGGDEEFKRRGGYMLSSRRDDANAQLPSTRPQTGRQWSGHLVAVLRGAGLLIDFDARQLARPERNIDIPDVMIVPWRGTEQECHLPSGTVVYYCVRRHPLTGGMDRTWEASPDWTADVTDLVDRLVRAARRANGDAR